MTDELNKSKGHNMQNELEKIRQRLEAVHLEAVNYASIHIKSLEGDVIDISSGVLTDIDRLLKVVERMREALVKDASNSTEPLKHFKCFADCDAILKGEG